MFKNFNFFKKYKKDILITLNNFGRVLHFEMVEEAENPTLPTKEELLEYLDETLFRETERHDYVI